MDCSHHEDGWGVCNAPTAARYLPGPRCPAHTPAALGGRPESVPDPALTLDGLRKAAGANPDAAMTPAGPTAIDTAAIRSGKRRPSPQDYRSAQGVAS